MKNSQAEELFNVLNSMVSIRGSHRELAQAKTLRNMKEWGQRIQEKVTDIKDSNCATKEVDGVKILLRDTVKRTVGGNTEEIKVNMYTPDGEKSCRDQLRALMNQEATTFEVYSTSDDANLTEYTKIVLREYGFLLTEEEFKEKVNAIVK